MPTPSPRRVVDKTIKKHTFDVLVDAFIRGIHYAAGSTVRLSEKDSKYLLLNGTIKRHAHNHVAVSEPAAPFPQAVSGAILPISQANQATQNTAATVTTGQTLASNAQASTEATSNTAAPSVPVTPSTDKGGSANA